MYVHTGTCTYTYRLAVVGCGRALSRTERNSVWQSLASGSWGEYIRRVQERTTRNEKRIEKGRSEMVQRDKEEAVVTSHIRACVCVCACCKAACLAIVERYGKPVGACLLACLLACSHTHAYTYTYTHTHARTLHRDATDILFAYDTLIHTWLRGRAAVYFSQCSLLQPTRTARRRHPHYVSCACAPFNASSH